MISYLHGLGLLLPASILVIRDVAFTGQLPTIFQDRYSASPVWFAPHSPNCILLRIITMLKVLLYCFSYVSFQGALGRLSYSRSVPHSPGKPRLCLTVFPPRRSTYMYAFLALVIDSSSCSRGRKKLQAILSRVSRCCCSVIAGNVAMNEPTCKRSTFPSSIQSHLTWLFKEPNCEVVFKIRPSMMSDMTTTLETTLTPPKAITFQVDIQST